MNLPSIKTLRQVFDHRAKEARDILEMTRACNVWTVNCAMAHRTARVPVWSFKRTAALP